MHPVSCGRCTDYCSLCTVAIEATKEGVKFACSGDIGNGSVTLRTHQNVEKPELSTKIDLTEPVNLTFSLKYLVNFCKASSLSQTVTLSLSNEVPLLVEYKMDNGYVRFYLAPKVCFHFVFPSLLCTLADHDRYYRLMRSNFGDLVYS